jgi:hypothetical protein
MNPTAIVRNQSFCLMASPALRTTTTTGFASDPAFDSIYGCICFVTFMLIRHQFVFPLSVRLLAAFFHVLIPFSTLFDFSAPYATFQRFLGGMDSILTAIVFECLRPSSTPPTLFRVFQASPTFHDLQ